jgi:hypothetical protein
MQFTKRPQSSGGDKKYLSLKDGESVAVLFRGNPVFHFVKWENGKATPVAENHPEAQFRFTINALVKENAAWVAKIWDQGTIVYNMLADLNEDYPLEDTVIKITRRGTKTDTTYMILPNKEQPNPKQLESMKQVELNDLNPGHAKKIDDDEVLSF